MKHSKIRLLVAVLLPVAFLVLAACSSEKKPEGSSGTKTSVNVEPGVAGGTYEETFTASATVTDLDLAKRRVTLTSSEGNKVTFTAGPEIRNLDQVRVGDKVNATITDKLVIFVRSDGADPSITHASALMAAPKGARPGVMSAETYETVARIMSIDTVGRTATLQFAGGSTKTVNVRSDVDLSKYKAGDSVVMQVSETLSVLVENK